MNDSMKREEAALENRSASMRGLIGSMVLFGTIGVFVRRIALPSSVIALARAVVGALFLLLTARLRRTAGSGFAIRGNWVKLLASGVLLGANWILLFEAYRYTTVATATLCYYFAPVFVILASPLVLGERLSGRRAACAAVAVLGMALVSGVFEGSAASGAASPAGILLGIGAAAGYAGVVLLNKRMQNIAGSERTLLQLSVAAVTLLPYTLLTVDLSALQIGPAAAALLLIVGVAHTGVAYALYFSSLQTLRAQTVAICSYIDPIVAILLSALLLREKMSVWSAAGAALILASTLASELDGRKTDGAKKEHGAADAEGCPQSGDDEEAEEESAR